MRPRFATGKIGGQQDGHTDRTSSSRPPREDAIAYEDDPVCVPIQCSECLKRISKDVVASPEGEDYVRHFCGLGCLRRREVRRAQLTQTGSPIRKTG